MTSDALISGHAPKDSILSRESQAVSVFDESIGHLVEDLSDTLLAHPVAIGLAAPQIGVDLAVAVVNIERAPSGPSVVLINPRIQSTSGKKDRKRESCMSVPGYAGEVERRWKVHVSYYDMDGNPQLKGFEGFTARVVQHEVDHLNGILYPVHTVSSGRSLEATDIFDYQDPMPGSEGP